MEPVSTPAKKNSGANGAAAKPEKKLADPSELKQDHAKKQHGKGKIGSLENPEVYENVPGHVIPILQREFDDFDTEAASFLRGEQTEEQFIGFRLKQGVYGQRQPDVQMIRVKLPYGGVSPEQMEDFADAIAELAPLNKGHITTRAHGPDKLRGSPRSQSRPRRTSRSTTSRWPTRPSSSARSQRPASPPARA